MEKQEFKGVSKRARYLLTGQETIDVDFKRSIAGLSNEDIVAFANSESGGAILIGVDEVKSSDGRQKGSITGCPIGDEEKRKIIDRAENCIPPIDLYIFIENLNAKPFLRVEIPSGPEKPYCTGSGTYKIRGDGVNKTLTPQRLLQLFMESEGKIFLDRFRDATNELANKLDRLNSSSLTLQEILDSTMNSAANAESLADDTMGLADMAAGGIEEVAGKLEAIDSWSIPYIQKKLDALLSHFSIEDPREKEGRTWAEGRVEELLSMGMQDKEILERISEQWGAGFVNAAWNEVMGWARAKLGKVHDDRGNDDG